MNQIVTRDHQIQGEVTVVAILWKIISVTSPLQEMYLEVCLVFIGKHYIILQKVNNSIIRFLCTLLSSNSYLLHLNTFEYI